MHIVEAKEICIEQHLLKIIKIKTSNSQGHIQFGSMLSSKWLQFIQIDVFRARHKVVWNDWIELEFLQIFEAFQFWYTVQNLLSRVLKLLTDEPSGDTSSLEALGSEIFLFQSPASLLPYMELILDKKIKIFFLKKL